MTSHAAQGLTVDKVFLAGASSREGFYVSATRGRESIRVFVPDREAFLAAAGLRSEAHLSATEFARQYRLPTRPEVTPGDPKNTAEHDSDAACPSALALFRASRRGLSSSVNARESKYYRQVAADCPDTLPGIARTIEMREEL